MSVLKTARIRFLGLIGPVLLILLSACAQVPRQELDAYRQSFNSAKSAAEDVMLQSKVWAKDWATASNHRTPVKQRIEKQQQWIADADTRLAALDTIAAYNSALIKLAEGQDPESVKSDLVTLGENVKGLRIRELSSLVGSVLPFADIAAQVIALVDNAIRVEQFRLAVRDAQKPISGIVDILIKDADSLNEIANTRLDMERNAPFDRLTRVRLQFQNTANTYDKDARLDQLFKQQEEIRTSVKGVNVERVLRHQPGGSGDKKVPTKPATQEGMQILTQLTEEASESAAALNRINDRSGAQDDVTSAYKSLLTATKVAFTDLNAAVEAKRRAGTADFIAQARSLREAFLKLREGR